MSAKTIIAGKRKKPNPRFLTDADEADFSCYCFPKDEFVNLAFHYMKEYSEIELANMWEHYEKLVQEKFNIYKEERERHSISVFHALFYYVDQILVVQNNEVLCQYNELLHWRNVTLELTEDLLVSAYLACIRTPERMIEQGFSWKLVIGHNNFQLNHIVQRGISENHFHLYGSAPIFHLSWLSLMNNILNSKTINYLREFDKDRRYANIRYGVNYEEESLENQVHQAALIRLQLFLYLTGQSIVYDKSSNFPSIKELLQNVYSIQFYLNEIQENINILRNSYSNAYGVSQSIEDYALLGIQDNFYGLDDYNDIFSGERWLIYTCLNRIYAEDFPEYLANYFYAYLVLKETLRSELIQSNENVGFINFQKYQSRKGQLMQDSVYKSSMVKWAVSQNLLKPYIESLEIRINPNTTMKKNREMIERLDKIIGEPYDKYFYVFHFIKFPDERDYAGEFVQCRHADLRKKVEKIAKSIVSLREECPKCASRVLGIDAASSEIGCRPEVFAHAFRYLRNHVWVVNDGLTREYLPQLRITYHAGEDFLDIVDGLRAIDETYNFLNMECGDRLGHALALGIDVEEWYHSKNNQILISQQDYLDNLVWMYHQLIQCRISGMDELMSFIEKKFSYYFQKIYESNMQASEMNMILKKMNSSRKIDNRTGNWSQKEKKISNNYQFNIFQYYHAWKLRGDAPSCYENGYFFWQDDIDEWNHTQVNHRFPKDFQIRFIPEVFLIYYYYHFNNGVRMEGRKKVQIKVNPSYIQAVKVIQKELQRCISQRGIAIETNPTSNFLIGTFKDYEKHPIFSFYNQGLTFDPRLLNECPQLSVSINTDDMGVFSTSLENEYALLANALEKALDENGKPKYKKSMVYEWIDAVRKMGNAQSFRERKNYN